MSNSTTNISLAHQDWMRRTLKGDPIIWLVVLLLTLLSVLIVFSAASAPAFRYRDGAIGGYLLKHVFLLGLSLFFMWLASRVSYERYARLSRIALLLSVPLLLYTYFRGVDVNDARRWITIPLINQTFQTSDLAKLALVTNLAAMLAKRQHNIGDFKRSVLPMLIWVGLICGLIALSNLSTALLLFFTCMVIMYIGRVPMKMFFKMIGVGLAGILLFLWLGSRFETAQNRMTDWWAMATGNVAPTEMPYQVQQAYMAMAQGGFFGVGLGHSQQKYFVPESYSDYIFAILLEEHGFKIGLLVMVLYLALLYRGMRVAFASEKAFGGLLSVGLSFLVCFQALMNMAVVVGLAPVTGQPLPFLSMGGTSLLFTGVSIGIILSVSRGDLKESNVGAGNQRQAVEE